MPDTPAFAGFVAVRSPGLLRLAYVLTGDWASGEDLLQTALTKAWRAWPRISGNPEPYVRRTMLTTYLSWRRRRWNGETPSALLPEVAIRDRVDEVDERDAMWQALQRLPRRQRAVVALRYLEDLSEAETARLLEIRAGTVKSQCAKALRTLRVDPDLVGDRTSGKVVDRAAD